MKYGDSLIFTLLLNLEVMLHEIVFRISCFICVYAYEEFGTH